jgi:hypothetical protein
VPLTMSLGMLEKGELPKIDIVLGPSGPNQQITADDRITAATYFDALADLLRKRKLADPATIRIAFINYR